MSQITKITKIDKIDKVDFGDISSPLGIIWISLPFSRLLLLPLLLSLPHFLLILFPPPTTLFLGPLCRRPWGRFPPADHLLNQSGALLSGCIDDLSTPETPLFLVSISLFCLSTSISGSPISSKSRHFSIVIVLCLSFPDAALLITTTRNLLVHRGAGLFYAQNFRILRFLRGNDQ